MSQPISVGRSVQYCLPGYVSHYEDGADSDGNPCQVPVYEQRWRPAQVVNAFTPELANLVVFLDPANDLRDGGRALRKSSQRLEVLAGCLIHPMSVGMGEGPGQWRYPPFVPPAASAVEREAKLADAEAKPATEKPKKGKAAPQ